MGIDIEEGLKNKRFSILVIGNPFRFLGGGQRRIYEVVKCYPELGIDVTLFIPRTHLLLTKVLQHRFKIKDEQVYGELRKLEKAGVYIPEGTYYELDKIEQVLQKDPTLYRREGVRWVFNNFRELLPLIDANAIKHAKKFVEEENERLRNINVIYCMDNFLCHISSGFFLAATLHLPLFILLQSPPFISSLRRFLMDEVFGSRLSERSHLRTILRLLIRSFEQSYFKAKSLYNYSRITNVLRAVFAVSDAAFRISGLDSWLRKNNVQTKVLFPGNAVDEELAMHCLRRRIDILGDKEAVAVFYARLNISKGILEIPLIAKYLQEHGYKISIMGRFDSIRVQKVFEKLCMRFGVKNVEYLGYITGKQLWDMVARSKTLIYPSHFDTFSLTVLEALFLGNSVVAYDIPAIKTVYCGLKPVRIVPEYDYKAMSREAVNILKMNQKQFIEEHIDVKLLNFLKLHSSWRNVAKAEIEAILKLT